MCECVPPRPSTRPLPCLCCPAAMSATVAPAADLPPLPQQQPPEPSHGIVHNNKSVAAVGIACGRVPPSLVCDCFSPQLPCPRLLHCSISLYTGVLTCSLIPSRLGQQPSLCVVGHQPTASRAIPCLLPPLLVPSLPQREVSLPLQNPAQRNIPCPPLGLSSLGEPYGAAVGAPPLLPHILPLPDPLSVHCPEFVYRLGEGQAL